MIAHVFLGGTVGTNTWREEVIPELTRRGIPAEALYDPPVDAWTEEIQAREDAVKREAAYHLYVTLILVDRAMPCRPIAWWKP
jgi:hypothetical protein